MILVRDVFRLKFGKAKDAQALLKEGLRIAKKAGFSLDRALMDVTGPFYTWYSRAATRAWRPGNRPAARPWRRRSGAPGTRGSSLW